MSAPALDQVRQPLVEPDVRRDDVGKPARQRRATSPRSAARRCRAARTTRPSPGSSSATACSRSNPFWSTSRDTMPMSGRASVVSLTGNPNTSSTRRFAAALPSRSIDVERLRQVRVARRIPLVVVDPVEDAHQLRRRARAGCRRSRTRTAGVWISSAYRGLTVVTMRLKTMPAFRKLMRPQYSMPSTRISEPPRPSRGSQLASNTPWYARLWMVNTTGTRDSAGAGVRRHRQDDRHQAGLPVVRVDHVVARAGQRRPSQRRVRQEREALRVVGEVLPLRAVDAVAIEVGRLVDEDRPDAVGGHGVDAGVERLRARASR